MGLTPEEVLHVAHLARLKLKPAEVEQFTRQLNAILEYFAKLNEVDTSGVPPMTHVTPVVNVFREDLVREGLDRELTLKNAPARQEGSFVVPRVI